MRHLFLITSIFLLSFNSFSQKAKDFNVKYMLRGNIFAKSSIKDSTAIGGFSSSNNRPKRIIDNEKFTRKGLFLKIDNSKQITYNHVYNGYNLYIVNKTKQTQKFTASDSRLYVTAEAYVNNKWQSIEYIPISTCGNSYHSVYLKPNEYWEFKTHKFNGKLKTKIRYCLEKGKDKIYSNEIEASINKTQIFTKQKYNPKGLMDPYKN